MQWQMVPDVVIIIIFSLSILVCPKNNDISYTLDVNLFCIVHYI